MPIALDRSLVLRGPHLALHIFFDCGQHFFKIVEFIYPCIYNKSTLCRNYIVRFVFSLNGSHGHLHGTEEIGFFFELITIEPFNILYGLIDSIFSFGSCGVSGLAVRFAIQHH